MRTIVSGQVWLPQKLKAGLHLSSDGLPSGRPKTRAPGRMIDPSESVPRKKGWTRVTRQGKKGAGKDPGRMTLAPLGQGSRTVDVPGCGNHSENNILGP